MFLAFFVIPLVAGSISPGLYAITVLQIIFPVAFIFSSIDVGVDSVPVGLIVLPLPIKDVTIDMPELALSMSLVVDPFALIACSIWPHLDAVTVADIPLPLAFIDGTILESVLLSILKGKVVVYLILIKVLIRVLLMPVHSLILFLILLIEVVIECGTPFELMCASDAVLATATIHAVILEVILLHLLASTLHTMVRPMRILPDTVQLNPDYYQLAWLAGTSSEHLLSGAPCSIGVRRSHWKRARLYHRP
jgi:hypothetical protein